MKKLLIVCGLLFSVITFAHAQQGGGRKMPSPEERAKRNTDRLAEKLTLTEDQKTKVSTIFLDQATAVDKIREAGSGDREATRAQVLKLSDETDAKIAAVLTADQKKTYEAWRAEQKEKMKNRERGDGPRGGGNQ